MVDAKKALRRLWMDRLAVTEYQKYTKLDKSTGFQEAVVLEDQPCKLSFSTLQSVTQGDDAAALTQVAKLFLDNTVTIKPGSRLTVRRKVGGAVEIFEFSQSGLPGVFSSHQEIVLVPFKGWA